MTGIIRQRLGGRVREQRGFTLIELLVVMIMVGILAAIALAVFLNQRQRAHDAKAKSNVTNIVREIQACTAGNNTSFDDFRTCDDTTALQERSIEIDPRVQELNGNNNCRTASQTLSNPSLAVASGFDVRIVQAGLDCFVVVGVSNSGNVFAYAKQNGNVILRDCTIHGKTGCPSTGQWAG